MKRIFALSYVIGVLMATSVAQSQQVNIGPQKSAAVSNIEETVVTGTRRQGRTVLESAASIDVLSGDELAAQTTSNMLDTLSNAVPSFTVGQNSISDASSFIRAPSLRGLPSD